MSVNKLEKKIIKHRTKMGTWILEKIEKEFLSHLSRQEPH